MKTLRLEKVLKSMEESKLSQILVTDPVSIFYLTGKWIHPGERMLALYINIQGNHKLFINELFPVEEELGAEKIWFNDTDNPIDILINYLDKDHALGIDKNWPAHFLISLMDKKVIPQFINGSFIVDDLRMMKDQEEIELMKEASRLNDEAMGKLINEISNAHSELDMIARLDKIYKNIGADGFSFTPIIGYGANAADPHHNSDHTKLKRGDSIVLDIGCLKNSYCSDMTRTVFYKEVSPKAKEVYQVVLEANKRGIETVKPGAKFCDIDRATRNYIEEAGYGKYFTHRTGHSIGIEVHDKGDVSSTNTEVLKPGMIFSIEPGIYIPGEVGVRIEDLVLVTEDGYEVLNHFNKELQVIE